MFEYICKHATSFTDCSHACLDLCCLWTNCPPLFHSNWFAGGYYPFSRGISRFWASLIWFWCICAALHQFVHTDSGLMHFWTLICQHTAFFNEDLQTFALVDLSHTDLPVVDDGFKGVFAQEECKLTQLNCWSWCGVGGSQKGSTETTVQTSLWRGLHRFELNRSVGISVWDLMVLEKLSAPLQHLCC